MAVFGNEFNIDDRVAFDISDNENTCQGTGTVLGKSSSGLIDLYIVELDHLMEGFPDRAIIVPNTLMFLL